MLSNDSWLTKFEKTHEAEGAEIRDTDRKTEKENIFLRKNQKGKFAFTENSNAQTSWSNTHVAAKQGSMENKAKFMKEYLFYVSNKFQIVNRKKNLKEKHWED